jgi:hypothetical protein
MLSIGPFKPTEAEFFPLQFLRQEEERWLSKTSLRATWSGGELSIKSAQKAVIFICGNAIDPRSALPEPH